MVITDDTNSHYSNSSVFVSFNLIGEHCLFNYDLSIYLPIIGAALIVASRRSDLSCEDPSASLYGEPLN